MTFAQLTYRESLRDIEACLRAMQDRLYHMGIRGKVSRNTLPVANKKRDWRIYADFAQILINEARQLYADEPFGFSITTASRRSAETRLQDPDYHPSSAENWGLYSDLQRQQSRGLQLYTSLYRHSGLNPDPSCRIAPSG